MNIDSNSFTNLYSYFDVSGIFIRSTYVTPIADLTQVSSESELLCGGYRINSNIFTNSLSCPMSGGGVLTFECIQEDTVIDPNDSSWSNIGDPVITGTASDTAKHADSTETNFLDASIPISTTLPATTSGVEVLKY